MIFTCLPRHHGAQTAVRRPSQTRSQFTTRGAHALHSTSTSSFYNGHVPKAGECSNHYIKMPAMLAALAAPGINGVYFVDLDAVVRYHASLAPSE